MKWPQIVVPVRVPRRDRTYAKQVVGFFAEDVKVPIIPEPIHYGDFWNVGKDQRHAWPHRFLYATDNSASTLSIAAPLSSDGAFKFPTVPSAMVQRPATFAPHQFQKPTREPVALKTPSPVSWSSQNTLAPAVGFSSAYAKLL